MSTKQTSLTHWNKPSSWDSGWTSAHCWGISIVMSTYEHTQSDVEVKYSASDAVISCSDQVIKVHCRWPGTINLTVHPQPPTHKASFVCGCVCVGIQLAVRGLNRILSLMWIRRSPRSWLKWRLQIVCRSAWGVCVAHICDGLSHWHLLSNVSQSSLTCMTRAEWS